VPMRCTTATITGIIVAIAGTATTTIGATTIITTTIGTIDTITIIIIITATITEPACAAPRRPRPHLGRGLFASIGTNTHVIGVTVNDL
jgi:hypothetical protein